MSLFSKTKKKYEKAEDAKRSVSQPEDKFKYPELDTLFEESMDFPSNTFPSIFEDYYESYNGANFYQKYLKK